MDPALFELMAEGAPDDDVAVVLRLDRNRPPPPGLRIVVRFGDIATGRLRRGSIPEVRADDSVLSMKAPGRYRAELEAPVAEDVDPGDLAPRASDRRRPEGLAETGQRVLVGHIDWGADFAHPDFRRADGRTRFAAIWDQGAAFDPAHPNPYGYGRIHSAAEIDRALRAEDPYAALGYHPARGKPAGGSHGSHTLGISAGNGRAKGPCGIAPEAVLAFVDLSTHNQPASAGLGDSAALLEALHFFAVLARSLGRAALLSSPSPQSARRSSSRSSASRLNAAEAPAERRADAGAALPLVINASLGRQAGQHDGRTLTELGMDAFLAAAPGRAIVQSTGNYFDRGIHAAGLLRPGGRAALEVRVPSTPHPAHEVDLWYPGRDRIALTVRGPGGMAPVAVAADAWATLNLAGRGVGRVYHRLADPNNGDNHVALYLDADAPEGRWTLELAGDDIVDGRWHAWIERGPGGRALQARFDAADDSRCCTLGTICNGLRTVAVGACDGHDPERPLAPFSSGGPTRDGRGKPDLVAPGVRVLSARSAGDDGRQHPALMRLSGSSMAAPMVTGTVALMFAAAHRPLPIDVTRRLLLASTEAPPAAADAIDRWRWGAGYLDSAAAVAAARSHPAKNGIAAGRPAARSQADPVPSASVPSASVPSASVASASLPSASMPSASLRSGPDPVTPTRVSHAMSTSSPNDAGSTVLPDALDGGWQPAELSSTGCGCQAPGGPVAPGSAEANGRAEAADPAAGPEVAEAAELARRSRYEPPAPLPFQFQIPLGGGAPGLSVPIGGAGSPFAFAVPLGGGTPAPAPAPPAPSATSSAPASDASAGAPPLPSRATTAGATGLAAVPAAAFDAPVVVSTGIGEAAVDAGYDPPVAARPPHLSWLAAAEAVCRDKSGAARRSTSELLGRLMRPAGDGDRAGGDRFSALGADGPLPSATALFNAFVYADGHPLRSRLQARYGRHLTVLARPGTPLQGVAVQPGDLLLRVALGQGHGHVAVVASPVVCRDDELPLCAWQAPGRAGARPGFYVQVVEMWPRRRSLADRWARRIADARGRLPADTLLLRRLVPFNAVPPQPMEDAIDALTEDAAADMRWLQSALNQVLGLQLGVDGIAGPKTRSAIRSFQGRNGLAVDGIAGPRTQAALRAALSGVEASPTTTTTARTGAGSGGGGGTGSGNGGGSDLALAGLAGLAAPDCLTLDRFAQGSEALTPAHQRQVIAAAQRILRAGIRAVVITGFASSEGGDAENLALGLRRATATARALAETLERMRPGSAAGVALVPTSRGESDQVSGGEFDANRRVTICLQTQPPVPTPEPPVQPTITRVFRVVVKSFIARIGGRIGSLDCGIDVGPLRIPGASNAALRVLAAATDAAFSEDPVDDRVFVSPPPENKGYRLFSRGSVQAECRGTALLSLSLRGSLETDSGKECLPGTSGCLQAPPLIVDQAFTQRRVDGSRIAFRWAVKGRPPEFAENAFNTICHRDSVFIWHQVDGVVDCSSGVAQVTGLALTGSRFPAHRAWVDGSVAQDVPQGPYSALWDSAPGDPTRVR